MKRYYFALLVLIATCFLQAPQHIFACVDPPPPIPTIRVTVNYDTIGTIPCSRYIGEAEIRVSNLRLMAEDPTKICACALSSFSDIFTNLQYIAFVDSGTNSPYDGFADFEKKLVASNSWNSSQPNYGGWDGFIANVINSGLKASDPVELVIRASPPQNTLIPVDSNCVDDTIEDKINQSYVGTDEWDPQTLTIKDDHQGISFLGTNATYVGKKSDYFTDLDDDILGNPQSIVFLYRENSISIFPNPVKGQLNIQFDDFKEGDVKVTIMDISGREIQNLPIEKLTAGKQVITYDTSLYLKETGVYFVKVQTPDQISLEKIIYSQ